MDSKQFLQVVLGYIRAKNAKKSVQLELSQHLLHAKNAWMSKGYNAVEAEAKAVAEMGNPATLGKSLNRLHKPKIDWLLWALFGSMLLLGFLPLFSLEETQFTREGIDALLSSKIFQTALGILLAVIIMFIDFRKLARYGLIFYALAVGSLFFLAYFSNDRINGQAMFSLFGLTMQVWHVLPLLCLAFAALLSEKKWPLPIALLLAIIPAFFIMLMPDLGMLAVYCLLVFVLFLCSTYSKKQKTMVIGALLVAVISLLLWLFIAYKNGSIASYQLTRLFSFLNPAAYSDTDGYVNYLLIQLVDQAKWFDSSSTFPLPEPITDLVLAQLIQAYGLVPAFGIIALLLMIVWRLFYIAQTVRLPFGRFVAIGALTIIATQLLYVTAMTFGLVPLASFSLPFISYGLTPTLLNAIWIGFALSMYRYGRFATKE